MTDAAEIASAAKHAVILRRMIARMISPASDRVNGSRPR